MSLAPTGALGETVSAFQARLATYLDALNVMGPATLVVAANDAPAAVKARADYVCDGTGDEVQINAALAASKSVVLSTGTFSIAHDIYVSQDNACLSGSGWGTIISPASGWTVTAGHISGGSAGSSACIVVDNGTGTTPVAKATIESLQIEGNNIGSVGTPVSGLYFRTYHGRLNNVFVRRTSGYGIHIEGYSSPFFETFDTMIHGCVTENTWLTGFQCSGQIAGDLVFSNCKAIGAGNTTLNPGIGAVTYTSSHGFAFLTASNQMVNCHPYGNAGCGILTYGSYHKFIGCKIEGNRHGLSFQNSTSNFQIVGCNFRVGSGTSTSSLILLPAGGATGQGYSIITGCKFSSLNDIGANSCQWAINMADFTSQLLLITGNSFDGASAWGGGAAINFQGSTGSSNGHMVTNNMGFITQASGTATIASGSTSIAVTHGLSYTPTARDIQISLTNNPTVAPGVCWISSVGATTFTINCATNPSTSGAIFAWQAMRLGVQ
jgi:hypothetical protein